MEDRIKISTNVVKEAVENLENIGNILLVENYDKVLYDFLEKKGTKIFTWNRYFSSLFESSIWIDNNLFDTVIIKLPKSHASFDMILNAISSVDFQKKFKVIVYGMTDEGIKGAKKKMKAFFGNVETIFFKKRCHVLSSEKNTQFEKKELKDFKINANLSYKDYSVNIEFYPGMFCAGRLDLGTEILLNNLLLIIDNEKSILDYGCGSGIIGVIIKKKFPNIQYTGLDVDSIALFASENNIYDANFMLNDCIDTDKLSKYDMIVSNPPMHTEKIEHTKIIKELIKNSPKILKENGKLIMVVQSRLNLEKDFKKHFRKYEILERTNQFTVYLATKNIQK